ncbi:MAG: uroporphyrinogen decarboxylase [Alicyclobacillus macrosporangiidus]|uniref:uroporphyrinogen decarboxylase n=1 Tax=Alicyclobacillus macrosporangiidus TaxID=392015 RepID=UPI0026F0144D|nr:uroporphyrinogen decarboxylase [Alicyclobacillus macrosporangiidus]MCL6597526.1 uroporphyrinogen decarboxylase [Alicyclobacillus macrosporangiidus]
MAQHPFLLACQRQPVPYVPVWYMRQAGRYQPEYRQLRERYSLLDICRIPELCMEVTRLPVTQLGVDAAILFSDIMVPLGPMGVDFDIVEHVGPVTHNPVQSAADVARLRVYDPAAELPYVAESVRLICDSVDVPLIGFAGAPFTLASYIVEGRPSRDYLKTKRLMWSEPAVWQSLMDKLADVVIRYLRMQIDAGAAAVQLFDSWVGSLAPEDFQAHVLPAMRRIFGAIADTGVPAIYFGVGTGELLPLFAEAGASVVGVDWRVSIREARRRTGGGVAIQGNLDPALLLAPWPEIERRARSVIDQGLEADGFIFNLGHGVVYHQPPVAVDTLRRLTEFVHEYSALRIGAGRNGA